MRNRHEEESEDDVEDLVRKGNKDEKDCDDDMRI